MSSDTAIRIKNLSKTYRLYARPRDRLIELLTGRQYFVPFAALNNVSLDIKKGETLGLVGHNGSGKSTLLQLICGTLTATSGQIETQGRISALLELGAGFNPEFTGHENIFLNAAILGLTDAETREKYDAIVAFSGIGAHLQQPVKTYSSGMYVRLAFAIAIASEPDILIVDEALSVGDIAFQRKCFSRIRELQAKGATVVFVSHSVNTILELCDRAVLLDHGEKLMEGAPAAVMAQYHRLMFAPEKALPAVRAEIRAGIAQNSASPSKKSLAAHFDPYLAPESTVFYEPNGAEISNIRVTDAKGNPVNLLKRGKTYHYRYDVRFLEAAKSVRFGMNIKTNTGMVLGGASTHTEKKPIAAIKKGKKISVDFSFTCRLLPGVYFTNAGCTAVKQSERVNLHRVLDACLFRVLPEAEETATGKVDFGITSTVKGV